jgi:ferredoxin
MNFNQVKITLLKQDSSSQKIKENILFVKNTNVVVNKNVLLIDFTEEELLFLALDDESAPQNTLEMKQEAPCVDLSRCKRCGECVRICKNEAIVLEKSSGKVIIFPERCASCGKCYFFCSKQGLRPREYKTAIIEILELNKNLFVAQCYYKNLSLQIKQILRYTLKALTWQSKDTTLYLFFREDQWDEQFLHVFNSFEMQTI